MSASAHQLQTNCEEDIAVDRKPIPNITHNITSQTSQLPYCSALCYIPKLFSEAAEAQVALLFDRLPTTVEPPLTTPNFSFSTTTMGCGTSVSIQNSMSRLVSCSVLHS